jgi:hypothetical protein
MAGIVIAAIVLGLLLQLMQHAWVARASRPHLPEADRAPAGLGRLIPVGAQVEEEYRRGVVALEHWLLSHRQAGRGGA